jgi:hypothetical protein
LRQEEEEEEEEEEEGDEAEADEAEADEAEADEEAEEGEEFVRRICKIDCLEAHVAGLHRRAAGAMSNQTRP